MVHADVSAQEPHNPVVIPGIPSLGWGRGRECTFAGALEAALAVTPHPATYQQIMGWSGLAFRTRWFRNNTEPIWCPSSPVGEFQPEIEATAAATGWTLDGVCHWGDPNVKGSAPRIVQSLRAGAPVLCYDGHMNVAVIHGCSEDGSQMLVGDYENGDTPQWRSTDDIKCMLIMLGSHTPQLSPREALRAGLRKAIANWDREPEPAPELPRRYLYGAAALRQWADDVRAKDSFTEDERGGLFFVSWWCFTSLADARQAAVEFLTYAAEEQHCEAALALKDAAALYGEEAGHLSKVFQNKDAFLGPWTGKSVTDWTAEIAHREADVLECAREVETKAVEALRRAEAAL